MVYDPYFPYLKAILVYLISNKSLNFFRADTPADTPVDVWILQYHFEYPGRTHDSGKLLRAFPPPPSIPTPPPLLLELQIRLPPYAYAYSE